MDAFEDLLPEPMRPPLTAEDALDTLKLWADAGWLRHLDHAFARFVLDVSADEPAPVLVAAALLVHMEGRGHTCLVVGELVDRGAALLGWPAPATEAWGALAARLPAQPTAWLDALARSGVVASATTASGGSTPLVLDGERLYLRRHWLDERHVAEHVAARVGHAAPVDEAVARHWLDTLFGGPPSAGSFDWQKFACAVSLRSHLSVITGGPGTGKTYTAARLLALLWAMAPQRDHLRIALAAPTGKAAARLRQSIDGALQGLRASLGDAELPQWMPRLPAARTLHGLLGARPGTRRFMHGAANPLDIDVLVVDEASMVHLEMMAALFDALPAGARVVLLGDKDQLASVEAGAVLGDLCQGAEAGGYDEATCRYAEAVTGQAVPPEFHGRRSALAQQTVMLRESRRFGGPIGHLATAVNEGDSQRAQSLLKEGGGGMLSWPESPSPATAVRLAVDGYRPFTSLLSSGPPAGDGAHALWAREVLAAFDRFRLLCAVHDSEWGVVGLNAAVARALADEAGLAARGEWYEGRPVMVLRNLPEAGVYNGDIGVVLRVEPGTASASPWRVFFADGDGVRSVSIGRLAEVDTAFAMTVHKSQGSEFAHTVLVLPEAPSRVLTRELVYTGITRARERFTLVTGRPRAFAEALAEKTRRFSGLLEALRRTT